MGTRRPADVDATSSRRIDVSPTLKFDVICLLGAGGWSLNIPSTLSLAVYIFSAFRISGP